MLRLHDTAQGRVVDVVPRQAGRLAMYICGPTVYDLPHLGHGRATLTYDILRRFLEWTGVEVHHVSNVTDIDDNIINRAAEQGRSAEEVARDYETKYWESMDQLGVLRPHRSPRATEYVGPMVEIIERLIATGTAYQTSDGVYLSVAEVPGYGLLARQSLDSLRAGARVEVDEEKRSPVDFVLWKRAKEAEPSWPSPWGPGRPGWHTECVAMSLDLLGQDFDLHGGGADLAFPHHENERAQAVVLGQKFARHWIHHAFIMSGREKMSKSLGNFTSLPDLLSRTDPRAYRMLVVRAHYRSPLEVGPDTIADAEEALARLDALARRMAGAVPGPGPGPDQAVLARFRDFMEDDLNTPRATAVIFEEVRRANAAADSGAWAQATQAAASVRVMAGVLGLDVGGQAAVIDVESADLVSRRDDARAERDFTTSDALRAELVARGWVVEDSAQGTRLRR
ncbi:MAG: cysteine--tRNA ligase [Acidimicrobiales bacterium]